MGNDARGAHTAEGLHKQGLLVDETGAVTVEMMRVNRRAPDRKKIANPGKIFAR